MSLYNSGISFEYKFQIQLLILLPWTTPQCGELRITESYVSSFTYCLRFLKKRFKNI